MQRRRGREKRKSNKVKDGKGRRVLVGNRKKRQVTGEGKGSGKGKGMRKGTE